MWYWLDFISLSPSGILGFRIELMVFNADVLKFHVVLTNHRHVVPMHSTVELVDKFRVDYPNELT